MVDTRPIRAVWPGQPYPRGATWDGEGVNFSLFSANADKVELCIFDPSGRHELQRIQCRERTDEIWHCYLPEARPGTPADKAAAMEAFVNVPSVPARREDGKSLG